ncbi:MAG: hypothetical protein V2G41_10095 [bacterium JZ-2024 1]
MGRVVPIRDTKSGWRIATVHYSVVPGYNFEAATRGLSDEAIRQEFEIDWSTTKGRRVYPEFGREHHIATEPLEYNSGRPLYCGWDFGGCPALAITQVNALGQWLIFPPVVPGEESSVGVYEFGQIVADHLTREYAVPNGLDLKQLQVVHFGDPAGAAPPPRVGERPRETRSCFDIIYKGIEIDVGRSKDGERAIIRKPGFGWRIIPGKVGITERLEAVRARLTMTLRDGLPALVVDPRATIIHEAFLGGYNYASRRDGGYDYFPEKNYYSHIMDALGYIATRLFAYSSKGLEEEDMWDDEAYYCRGFRSHASGREGW